MQGAAPADSAVSSARRPRPKRMKTILALAFLALPFTLQAQSNVDSSGVALKGYDPVAYFSEK